MKKFFALMLVLSVIVVFSACAQLQFNANVPEIRAAQEALDNAWVAGAATKASYEYNSAKAYLKAAEHEEAEHDYAAARGYAAKAVEQANKALEKSK